jgi:cellulose synthase/poly-beta-1,6-N-acetylglucosamine synthase-like glycosyltransferase
LSVILSYTLIFLTFIYFIVSIILLVGTIRLKKKTKLSDSIPYVSVIVPAKDEEKLIAKCLDSLLDQDYPADKYEIIVINDRSVDKTPDIIRQYQENHNKIKSIEIKTNTSGLTGKQNAINEGLELSKGEIIMNIDADCIATPKWIEKTVSHFTPETGLAMGFNITYGSEYNIFAELQSLDMLFLMDSASGSVGNNVYSSCAGSNIAYRKEILGDQGHKKLGLSVTEDTAVIHLISKSPNWNVSVVYDKDAMVMTPAEKSFKGFITQRIRWTLGGLASKSWILLPLYSIFLYHLGLMILIPIAFFVDSLDKVVLCSYVTKLIIDYIRCRHICKSFDRLELMKVFMMYEFFMIFYSVVIGFGSLFIRKIEWKGDTYDVFKIKD